MALRWDLEQIAGYEEVCWEPATVSDPDTGEVVPELGEDGSPLQKLRTRTEALIYATVAVGMGEITASNYIEFWMRLAAIEAWDGVWVGSPQGAWSPVDGAEPDEAGRVLCAQGEGQTPLPFTLECVRQHIGLKCNVSSETPAKWYGRRRQGIQESKRREFRLAAEHHDGTRQVEA